MESVNNYPFGPLPTRRLVIAGKGKPGNLHGELVKLQRVAERKRETFHSDAAGSPAETIDYDHYGAVMAERRRREASADEETK